MSSTRQNLSGPHAALLDRLVAGLSGRAVFMTDAEGCILSWNPGVERLLGYTEPEWVGKSAAMIYTPEDLAKGEFDREMQEAARTGEAADVRWHRRKDGSLAFIDGVIVALRDDTGSLVGYGKLMRDATDAKEAEESLRRSEERLRFAQEGAQLGIWDWDISTDLVTRSEVHYRLFGQEPQSEPETYACWLSHVHPDDREDVQKLTRIGLQNGDVESEFRVVWPDGSIHWMHARGKVYLQHGKPRRMVRVVREITSYKRAEQALADSEARKTAILNASLDALLVIDSEGFVQEFNPAAEHMFGYTREYAMGRSLGDLIVPPRLREGHRKGLARYLATGEARVVGKRIEIEALRADGSEFPVELAIVRVPVQGAPLFAGYVRDISERRRTEQALQRSNEELGHFAHVVAHDLQSPLRTVTAYTQLLGKRLEAEVQAGAQELISFVLNATKIMEILIQGLLQYATAGEDTPREPVNLQESVENVLKASASILEEAQAEVTYGTLPAVFANPVHIQQLFQNLITNAIKYRRPGVPPRIQIRAEAARSHWIVSVADNGEGIAAEYRERIFAPLSRLHGHDVPGTGLGLAVCKKIVERLGGTIWVESELGRGSVFRFSLPTTLNNP